MSYIAKKLLSMLSILILAAGLTACAGESTSGSDLGLAPPQTAEASSVSEPTYESESDSVIEPPHEPESAPVIDTTWEPASSSEPGNNELEKPWIDCQDDMGAAVEEAGFGFKIMPLSNYTIAVIPGEMIQVTYPRDEFDRIVLRKSPIVLEEGDISGDDTEYPESGMLTINEVEVSVRRDGDTIYVATFTTTDGTYCMSCTAGMTEVEVTQTLTELIEVNAK